jgi:hypothetical protein
MFTSEIASEIFFPNRLTDDPNGMTAKAMSAGTSTMIGAAV